MASPTGGVKPFSIETELHRERERLRGMTDEQRSWRAKWVKDQILSKNEPVQVCELEKELKNPIKRFYEKPFDRLYTILRPVIGAEAACFTRQMAGQLVIAMVLLYGGTYYFKYNANNWTRKGGWRVVPNRPGIYPGDPNFPYRAQRSPSEYSNQGFDQSPI